MRPTACCNCSYCYKKGGLETFNGVYECAAVPSGLGDIKDPHNEIADFCPIKNGVFVIGYAYQKNYNKIEFLRGRNEGNLYIWIKAIDFFVPDRAHYGMLNLQYFFNAEDAQKYIERHHGHDHRLDNAIVCKLVPEGDTYRMSPIEK